MSNQISSQITKNYEIKALPFVIRPVFVFEFFFFVLGHFSTSDFTNPITSYLLSKLLILNMRHIKNIASDSINHFHSL